MINKKKERSITPGVLLAAIGGALLIGLLTAQSAVAALGLSGALCSICQMVDTDVVEGVEKGAKKVRVHVGCPEFRCELFLSV